MAVACIELVHELHPVKTERVQEGGQTEPRGFHALQKENGGKTNNKSRHRKKANVRVSKTRSMNDTDLSIPMSTTTVKLALRNAKASVIMI